MTDTQPKNNFHFIRLLAALFVMVSHSFALNGLLEHDFMWQLTNGAFTCSYIGLATFFIISGFLITQSADTSKGDRATAAKSFLWKRFLRIVPAFVVVVLCSVFILGPLLTNWSIGGYFRSLSTWGYLQTLTIFNIKYYLPGVFSSNPLRTVNGSLWTIPYEVVCYLGVLLVATVGLRKIRTLLAVAFVLLVLRASFLPLHTSSPAFIIFHLDIFSLIRFGLYFMGGMLIYLFRDLIKMDWRVFGVCVLVLIGGMAVGGSLLTSFLVLPYIILFLAQVPSPLSKIAKYGDFSYGMYLYAFPVQQTIVHFLGVIPVVPMFIYSALFTFPLAYLSWRYVEKPALAFKSWIGRGTV